MVYITVHRSNANGPAGADQSLKSVRSCPGNEENLRWKGARRRVERAGPHEPRTAKGETIPTAQANSKVSVGRIIAAIRARNIRVHAPLGNTSYHGFKVCRSEFGGIE